MRRLARLTEEVEALQSAAGRTFYEIGSRLLQVRREELWRQTHRTFTEYLEERLSISRVSAYKFMRVAENFGAAIAQSYGAEKLVAALSYLEATEMEEAPDEVLNKTVAIREADGRFISKTLHEATATQIREATHALTHRDSFHTKKYAKLSRAIKQLERQLPAAPRGTGRGERVRLLRGDDGEVALTFQAIPVDGIKRFIDALERLPN